jgi:hypothetical protein
VASPHLKSQRVNEFSVNMNLPLVGVQAVEVNGLGGILTASEIVLQHWTKTAHVCRCVANRDVTVALGYS